MKCCLGVLLLVASSCFGQGWQAEVMLGTSNYKGDLTQRHFVIPTTRPSFAVNLKYDFGTAFLLRGGVAFAQVTGDDKYNKRPDLKDRNLHFKSNIVEVNLCVEYNLLEAEIFYAYPYAFAGIGLFHFDPFTYDKDNVKTFLRPLSTEGQGLAAYPEKEMYSKTQLCMPLGVGWKWKLDERFELAYELGFRVLFTDYLDDVSTRYVDPPTLLAERGAKAVELANRSQHPIGAGAVRGNPEVNDWYVFNGIKLMMRL